MENVILVWPDGDWEYEERMSSMDSINQFKSDDYEAVSVPEETSNEEVEEFVGFWLQSNQTDEDLKSWWELTQV